MRLKYVVAIVIFALIGLPLLLVVGGAGSSPGRARDTDDFLEGVRKRADSELAALSTSQGSVPVGAGGMARVPRLVLDVEELDMGRVPNDGITTAELLVRNEGASDLVISEITTECRCTTGKMVNDRIPPGETGTMLVKLDPSRVPGFYSAKTLSIKTNDPVKQLVPFKVKAEVEPEFAGIPDEVNFGTVAPNQTYEKTLLLRQVREEPFDVTGMAFHVREDSRLTWSYKQVDKAHWESPDKPEYEITLRLKTDDRLDPLNSYVDIETTIERMRKFPFLVAARVRPGAPQTAAHSHSG